MNRRNHFLSTLLMTSFLLFTLAACDQTNNNKIDMSNNPFAEASTLPFEAPDFDAIENEHFIPAFREGMRIQLEEMEQKIGRASCREEEEHWVVEVVGKDRK